MRYEAKWKCDKSDKSHLIGYSYSKAFLSLKTERSKSSHFTKLQPEVSDCLLGKWWIVQISAEWLQLNIQPSERPPQRRCFWRCCHKNRADCTTQHMFSCCFWHLLTVQSGQDAKLWHSHPDRRCGSYSLTVPVYSLSNFRSGLGPVSGRISHSSCACAEEHACWELQPRVCSRLNCEQVILGSGDTVGDVKPARPETCRRQSAHPEWLVGCWRQMGQIKGESQPGRIGEITLTVQTPQPTSTEEEDCFSVFGPRRKWAVKS